MHNHSVTAWLLTHGAGHATASALGPVLTQIPMMLIYAMLTIWPALLSKRPFPWLYAWILLTMAMVYVFVGIWFPWYMCWFFVPALIRWKTFDKLLILVSVSFALYYQPLYFF
jgi:hypothetical protein